MNSPILVYLGKIQIQKKKEIGKSCSVFEVNLKESVDYEVIIK